FLDGKSVWPGSSRHPSFSVVVSGRRSPLCDSAELAEQHSGGGRSALGGLRRHFLAEQVVEVPFLGAVDEAVDLFLRVDQGWAGRETGVTYRDRAVAQACHLGAGPLGLAALGLLPGHAGQLGRVDAVVGARGALTPLLRGEMSHADAPSYARASAPAL